MPPRHSDPPLVGRVCEVDGLRRALEQARRGTGAAVFIEGAAGLGKTRLVHEAERIAVDLGFRVLAGAAEELECGRPLGALRNVLRTTYGEPLPLEMPGPETERLAGSLLDALPATHWQTADRVLELVESLADTGPVLIAVDDLHLADPLSLSGLLALGRRLTGVRLCLLAAFRPVPPGSGLERLVDALSPRTGERLVLGELDDREAQELLNADLDGAAPPEIAPLARAAAGNPFYLHEVAATAREGLPLGHEPLPVRLRDAVLRHVRGMDDDEAAVLRMAAVLGSPFSVSDLATVCQLPHARLLSLLDRWMTVRLLTEAGTDDRLTFRHDLLRLAVYDAIPSALRSSLHVTVGRALAAAGAPTARVAGHLALGAPVGDRSAVDWLLRGAEELADRDPDRVVDLLDRALRLAGTAPTRTRITVRARLVEALARVNRTTEAEEMAAALLREGRLGEAELPVWRGKAITAFLKGGVAGAAAQLEQQLKGPAGSGSVPARTLAELALFKVASADLAGARDAVARAALVDADDRPAATLRRSVEALLALYDCRLGAAVAVATDACVLADLEAADGAGMQAHRYHPTFFQALALTDADAVAEAGVVLHRGRQLTAELGTPWAPPLYHCVTASLLLRRGDWGDAEAEADAARGFVEEYNVSVAAVWPHALLAWLALQRDDLAACTAALERGEREVAAAGLQFGTDLLALTRAGLLAAGGDAATAAGLLETVWAHAADVGLANVHRVMGPTYTRLLAGTGHPEQAQQVGRTLDGLASRSDVASVRAAALQCTGLATREPDTLLAAVDTWRRCPRPYDLAEACLDAAVALLHAGRRTEAAPLLEEADALAARLGAARLARLAAQHLPARRRRRTARPARPCSGWDSLTASEREVVRLLAQGASNGQIAERLFVSRRTVESHLYHVFTKVGVTSRVELAVQAVARLQ